MSISPKRRAAIDAFKARGREMALFRGDHREPSAAVAVTPLDALIEQAAAVARIKVACIAKKLSWAAFYTELKKQNLMKQELLNTYPELKEKR